MGYSDHTIGTEVAIAAVALGATVIEKHFDCNLPGPDHAASIMPEELKSLVVGVRRIQVSLGSVEKIPTEGELKNRLLVRKSIVASRSIAEGEMLSEDNLTTKRPGTGLSPMLWDRVVGTLAIRSFEVDEEIEI